MSIIVQKFGGTSVADVGRFQSAARRVVETKRQGHQVVVVVSARGKKTDELINLAREISANPPPREMDMLLATGEQESVALLAMAIRELGEKAISLTGAQIGIVTDSTHTLARIQKISTDRILNAFTENAIVVAAGFQGVDDAFNITTLGRGGSDTTATALAAVLQAERCEIYTDVEGVFTTDPRMIKNARKIERVSYDEMLELASLGAGVLHSRSIEFAKKYNVPIRVQSAHGDNEGTLISDEPIPNIPSVTGIASIRDSARVSLRELPDRPGMMSLIFENMAKRKIAIDMVVQDVSIDGRAEVSFTVPEEDLGETLTAADEAVTTIGQGVVEHGTNVSKVSVVGEGMRTHSGVAAKMFRSLAERNVNVDMVTTSEIKISVLVNRHDCDEAIVAVHGDFELDRQPPATKMVDEELSLRTERQIASRSDLERDVVARLSSMEDIVITEVELDTQQSRVTLSRLPDEPGVIADIFSTVANAGISVDMIVQNISRHGKAHLSFTVPQLDVKHCVEVLEPVLKQHGDSEVAFDKNIAKLSVMGIGLRSHTEVGKKMFRVFADANINVQMTNTSEIRMSAVVSPDDGVKAHRALLEMLGEP